VSEYISLVTLAVLTIVPARLMLGLGIPEAGEREYAVKEVSLPRPVRVARADAVGRVCWEVGEEMGETGSGSMKGSVGKKR
jgi:hypothetical protein